MQTLIEKNGQIVSEHLIFKKEGRGHEHNIWEICYILSGSGIIVSGKEKISVNKGDTCKIPPNTNHWMIPKPNLEILIVYTNNP